MGPESSSARQRLRRAAACIVVPLAWASASAQTAVDPTGLTGFKAGPFIIAPSIATSVAYDSNVFFQPESNEPSGDQVVVVQPSVILTLPFSNSVFRLGDIMKWTDYQKTPQTAGRIANDALAQLVFNFGSSDTLELLAHNVAGVAETQAFDPGGEVTFQGHAYDLHTETVTLTRQGGSGLGYRFSLKRNALNFDADQNVLFFNYRGFDGDAVYLQQLSSNTRLAVGYIGGRYDHYATENPYVIDRTEAGDMFYGQLDGSLGPRQPFSIRLGWERLAFELNDFKDFSGIVGTVSFGTIVGGGVVITGRAQRQPYRSFLEGNNYYIFELIGAQISRPFPMGSEFGGSFDVFRNSYDEPTESDHGLVYRHDRARRIEGYASLALREHVSLRFVISKNWRFSNFEGNDYDALSISGGFVFGWN